MGLIPFFPGAYLTPWQIYFPSQSPSNPKTVLILKANFFFKAQWMHILLTFTKLRGIFVMSG